MSSAADAEPFRDSDAVLSRFTNLDYDVLIVAQKGKLGYNNPLVKLILNLHCHSRTLESRNVQIQGVMRAIRILRLDDAWLRAVARRQPSMACRHAACPPRIAPAWPCAALHGPCSPLC